MFQGTFPGSNLAEDGYEFLSPVDSSPAIPAQNDYGLHHMIGNAWEWVEDWFTKVRIMTVPSRRETRLPSSCCGGLLVGLNYYPLVYLSTSLLTNQL